MDNLPLRPHSMSRDHSSPEWTQVIIRNPPNPLQEDPDVEEDIVYRTGPASTATQRQWRVCAATFSRYYGVWGPGAQTGMGPWAVPGRNILVSTRRLKALSLPEGANNILITAVTGAGVQVGHCFVSQWMHMGDRVWWITQLVVRPEYRDQRRATKMLQALSKTYDIGKNPNHKDFVGVLSPHPYTICAVLRVFGRGIESLPSRPDLERRPGPSSPLRAEKCASLMRKSLVEYVRTARTHPVSLAANTNFFVDHTVCDEAVRTISYAMNKQLREPWEWPFGDLPEGHEFMCVLRYRFDPDYSMRPQICEEAAVGPTPATSQATTTLHDPQPPVDYAQLNKFIVGNPVGEFTDPNLWQTSLETDERRAECLFTAEGTLMSAPNLISSVMDGKRVPPSLPPLYSRTVLVTDQHGAYYLTFTPTVLVSTWLEMKEWAEEIWDGVDVGTPLKLLQAVHFGVLAAEYETMREERRQKDRSRDGEETETRNERRTRDRRVRNTTPTQYTQSMASLATANSAITQRHVGRLPFIKLPSMIRRLLKPKMLPAPAHAGVARFKSSIGSLATMSSAVAQRPTAWSRFMRPFSLRHIARISKLKFSRPSMWKPRVSMPWRRTRLPPFEARLERERVGRKCEKEEEGGNIAEPVVGRNTP